MWSGHAFASCEGQQLVCLYNGIYAQAARHISVISFSLPTNALLNALERLVFPTA